jgi:hypothetical protein
MLGLLSTVLPVLGSAGFGSFLKILAGLIEGWSNRREARERRKLARELARSESARKWHAAAFGGTSESARYARGTRRIIAVIGVLTFSALCILGILFPSAELVTFAPAHTLGEVKFLWGLVSLPSDNDTTIKITSGHLPVVGLHTLAMIFGFYFTPGGSK